METRDLRRAVIYARQSLTTVEAMDDSLSIASQARACREYIARQGWRHTGTFEDPDQRGWRVSRPGFDAMLDRVRAGMADVVVVFKLSRFMRSLMDQERLIAEIADAGGELASVTEPYISTSPMVRQILGAVNEQHKRDMGDHLRAAWAERARRGIHHGGAPYGYRMVDGTLAVDDATGPVVQEMYRWAEAGHGAPEIAARLNARNIPTPRRGQRWYEERVLQTLQRPVYCGRIVLNGEVITDQGIHEPLVPPARFDAVQDTLARRRNVRRKEAPSWVDGFVVHACGQRMYAARHDNAGTRHRWRYRCSDTTPGPNRRADACPYRPGSMMVNRIEATFARLLIEALATLHDPETVAAAMERAAADADGDRDRERRRIERRIADVAAQRDRLLDLAIAGRVDDELYVQRDADLRDELARLRDELADAPSPVDRDELAARHGVLAHAAMALHTVLNHTPDDMPGILHALDVSLIIGDGPPRLRFGRATAPFFGS